MQGPEGEGGEFLDPITQPKNFLGIPFPSPFLDQIPVTVKLKENPRASDSSLWWLLNTILFSISLLRTSFSKKKVYMTDLQQQKNDLFEP